MVTIVFEPYAASSALTFELPYTLPLVMLSVATAPFALTLTPGPVKFKAVAFLTNIVPLLKTSI